MYRLFVTLLVAALGGALVGVATMKKPALAANPLPLPYPPAEHSDDQLCGGLTEPNLLYNPSFEGEYHSYVPPGGHPDCPHGICTTAQMAEGWTPYWLSPSDAPTPHYANPEYKPAELYHWPPRVHSGSRAQQYFSFWLSHEAGIYQRVSAIPGQLYCFGIWGHAWISHGDDPEISDGMLEQRIGVDPTGGSDWRSANIIWGGPRQYYTDPDNPEESAYGPFSLVVRAQSSNLTVYTWSRPVWPAKHNDVYWDDALLMRLPQEPTLDIERNEIAIVERPTEQNVHNLDIDINFSNDPGMVWRATADPGNTLNVSFSPAAGTSASDLNVTFDSAAYGPGSYSATLHVDADPAIPGSPQTIVITLNIFEELHHTHIPLLTH